jgi:hypothetical protein
MTITLTPTANRIAKLFLTPPISVTAPTPEDIREAADQASGGELLPSTLDRLCGMVERRLMNPARYGLKDPRLAVVRHWARPRPPPRRQDFGRARAARGKAGPR